MLLRLNSKNSIISATFSFIPSSRSPIAGDDYEQRVSEVVTIRVGQGMLSFLLSAHCNPVDTVPSVLRMGETSKTAGHNYTRMDASKEVDLQQPLVEKDKTKSAENTTVSVPTEGTFLVEDEPGKSTAMQVGNMFR